MVYDDDGVNTPIERPPWPPRPPEPLPGPDGVLVHPERTAIETGPTTE